MLLLSAAACFAQTKEIKFFLSVTKKEQTKPTPIGKVKAVIEPNRDGSYDLNVMIHNDRNEEFLYIFKNDTHERLLKKNRPLRIKFHKTFPGKKGTRSIRGCYEIDESIVCIAQDDERNIISKQIDDVREPTKIEMPIYLATKKGKKKMLVQGEQQLDLVISIENAPTPVVDQTYIRLHNSKDSLVEALQGKTFCPRNTHPVPLSRQKKPYTDKIDELKKETGEIIKRERLTTADERGRQYMQLKEDLENIKLREKNCGKCTVPPTTCKYCQQSLEAIVSKMTEIYIAVYNGESKSNYTTQMEAMYKCCTNHKSHVAEWKKGGKSVKQISDYYNQFNNRH